MYQFIQDSQGLKEQGSNSNDLLLLCLGVGIPAAAAHHVVVVAGYGFCGIRQGGNDISGIAIVRRSGEKGIEDSNGTCGGGIGRSSGSSSSRFKGLFDLSLGTNGGFEACSPRFGAKRSCLVDVVIVCHRWIIMLGARLGLAGILICVAAVVVYCAALLLGTGSTCCSCTSSSTTTI